jgi:hypothetical protein
MYESIVSPLNGSNAYLMYTNNLFIRIKSLILGYFNIYLI